MYDVVTFDFHAPGPEQRNAHSGERWGLFISRACARVVHYLVTHHVKHTRRTRCIGEEQHPHAIVVDLVTGDLAVAGIAHEDAKQITVGFVGGHNRVRVWGVTHVYTGLIGSACKVGDYRRSGRGEGGDPVFLIVEGTIGHELGVAYSDRDDPGGREAPHREAAYGHVVCLDAKACCSAGRGRLCRRLQHAVDSAQRDSVLLDRHGITVNAPENHDGVARMGGFDRLLDRFARTDDVSLGLRRGETCRHQQRQGHQYRHRGHQDDAPHKRNLLIASAAAGCTTGSPRLLSAHLHRNVALSLCTRVQGNTLPNLYIPVYPSHGLFLLFHVGQELA